MRKTKIVIALAGTVLFAEPMAAAAQAPAFLQRLIGDYSDTKDTAGLQTLARLQLAAGRWRDAELSIGRLSAMYRPLQPQRARALIPWRIYARSKGYEESGLSKPDALARAFKELFASLSDADFGSDYAWYDAPIDFLKDSQVRAESACADSPIDTCKSSASVIAARQALATWTYLMPDSRPLLRAEAERRFHVEDDLLIPTADGAKLQAFLVRPRSGNAKLTSLLEFTIYARDDWAFSEALEMASRGYAGMVAYSRGKGRSPGPAVPYEHDGADAATVIDWLAAQPWSDGQVGMFSGSYNASTQWGALKHHPKALKAIATHASNAPGIDTPMQGNVFQNFIYPWPLYATDTRGLDEANYNDSERWSDLNRKWYASGRPYRELELIDGHPNPVFAKWLEHPSYDSYWQSFIPVGDEFADIDIPVFAETGYFDGGMVGALYYFQEHVRHRPSADHRLLIGPYHHLAMTQGVLPNVAGYEVDRAALLDLRDVRMQWLDHVFRGTPLPPVLSARVNFEVMGENRWRHVNSLAEMAPLPMRLYLGSRRTGDALDFERRPAMGAGPTLTVDFRDRSDAETKIPAGALDRRNALLFSIGPFQEPVEIAGLFRGEFDMVVNKRDLDLSVQFYEALADGSYLPLHAYLGRASFMADRTTRHLLVPGRLAHLSFESQTVTARKLSAGSRLIAVVGVPRQPEIEINYGTGRDVADESIADAGEPLRIQFMPSSYLQISTRPLPDNGAQERSQ